jgi:hypothetical protein
LALGAGFIARCGPRVRSSVNRHIRFTGDIVDRLRAIQFGQFIVCVHIFEVGLIHV